MDTARADVPGPIRLRSTLDGILTWDKHLLAWHIPTEIPNRSKYTVVVAIAGEAEGWERSLPILSWSQLSVTLLDEVE